MLVRRVMIVDDEPALRAALRRTLRSSGIDVEDFADGRLAVERIRDQPFTCAILDLCMPGWDGVQTAVALLAVRPDLPLIMWSGGAPAALVARAHSLGLRAFFDKPCDMRGIVDEVLALS